ncbi:MAG: hypothetical protein JSS36_04990 [Proteobacteria bacterium]|nr:hypothetical protein [Pseudomonadota bacterium]
MNTFFVIIIVGLVIMVVVSLVRGIAAFLASTRADIDRGGAPGPSAMQLQQSKMMVRRILFQGAAIVVAMTLLALGGKHS